LTSCPPHRQLPSFPTRRSSDLERFMGEENVTPPSEDLLKNTEKFPGLSSNQTMLMFPLSSTAICGSCELPALFDAFTGREKTTWPSAAIAATTRNAPTVPTRQVIWRNSVLPCIIGHPSIGPIFLSAPGNSSCGWA